MGVEVAEKTPSLTGEFVGETHVVLEQPQTHPPGFSTRRAQNACGQPWRELEAGRELSRPYCSLLDPSPTYSATAQQRGLPHPGEYLRPHPLLLNRHSETKKSVPSGRTDQSSRKNTAKQQKGTHPIRCTVQNTGNQDANRIG